MSIRFLLVWTIFVFAICMCNAQKRERIDSLQHALNSDSAEDTLRVSTLNLLSGEYYHLDFDSSYFYAHQALALSNKIQYSYGLTEAFNNLGFAHIPWGHYDSAIWYFGKSLSLSEANSFKYLQSESYIGLGITNEESGHYKQALETYYQALAIKSRLNDQAGMGKIHNNLGQVFRNMGELDSATSHLLTALENDAFLKAYNDGASAYLILGMVKLSLEEYEASMPLFQESLKRLELPDQIIKIASSNGGLGRAFLELGDLDSAKFYLRLGLIQFSNIRHIGGEASLTAFLAEAFRAENNCDSAIYYYEKGIDLRKSANNLQYVARELTYLSMCLVQMGDLNRATQMTLEAARLAKELGSKTEASGAYSLLHEIYSRQGQFQKAYEVMKLSAAYRDSVLNQQRINEINRLENQHQINTIKKEQELIRANAMAEELRLKNEISRGKWIQFGTIAGTVVLIIVSLMLYLSLRRKRQDNALIAEKNIQISKNAEQLKLSKEKLEELTSFREGMTQMVAHDMKNTLNTIIGYSSVQSSGELKHVNHAGRQMLGLVTNMLDVQKFEEASMKIKKRQFSLEQLILRSKDQVRLLLVQKDLKVAENLQHDMIWGDPDIFDRVLVNLITNAIKYSNYGGQIEINSVIKENQYIISVIDEGVGISQEDLPHIFDKFWQGSSMKKSGESSSTGLGLTFCKMAVEAHEGSISAISQPEKGTSIVIALPKQQDQAVALSASDIKLLDPYRSRLKTKEVDEVGAIKDILSEITGSRAVDNWKQAIEQAIASGDQEQFDVIITARE
ncbi:MAG: ATP-binding protein [Cytophagales bacterium]|nr:ATP-binding protein [Cytophagales bacterium]